jgi:hypothetical protein
MAKNPGLARTGIGGISTSRNAWDSICSHGVAMIRKDHRNSKVNGGSAGGDSHGRQGKEWEGFRLEEQGSSWNPSR